MSQQSVIFMLVGVFIGYFAIGPIRGFIARLIP